MRFPVKVGQSAGQLRLGAFGGHFRRRSCLCKDCLPSKGDTRAVSERANSLSWKNVALRGRLGSQSKRSILAGPFDGQIAEPGDAHAKGEASFDRCCDQVGREESE